MNKKSNLPAALWLVAFILGAFFLDRLGGWRLNALLFCMAGVLALSLTSLFELPARKRMVLIAALTAGGLFLLPLVVPPSRMTALLGRGLLYWPAAFDLRLADNPVWASALVPLVLVFFLGLLKRTAPMVAGLCVGFATTLIAAGLTAGLSPWGSGTFSMLWLLGSGAMSIVFALACLGAMKVQKTA